jgi:hypothetical protein
MNRYAIALLVAISAGFSAPAAAQGVQGAPPPVVQQPEFIEIQDAQQTRERLQEMLRQHPPSVAVVLRNDPSLATPEYLAPYPALVNFIKQHPEVTRNPSYFFGTSETRGFPNQPADRSVQMFNEIMDGFTVMVVAGAIVGTFLWLIRFFVDHRRWLRASRTQAEVHTKLLDRLTNNEDLMAYMQTPAGRRFLESAPIALDDKPKSIGAPM